MIEHSPSAQEDMKQGYVRQIRFRTCACRKRRMAKYQVLSSCTADLPAMEAQEKSSAIADIPLSWPQQSLTDLVGKCTHLQSDDLDCGPVKHHEKGVNYAQKANVLVQSAAENCVQNAAASVEVV